MISIKRFFCIPLLGLTLMLLGACNNNGIQQGKTANLDKNIANSAIKANTNNAVQEMSSQTLLNILEKADPKYQIIDVRSPEEFRAGHVANAVNVPHENLLKNVSYLDPYIDKELIFYCESGRRVGLVTDMLSIQNYKAVHHLSGDMIAWRKKSYPLVK